MNHQPLATRLWRLPDQTQCLELQDARRGGWEIRVVRDFEVLQAAFFKDRLIAEREGTAWRTQYERRRNA